MSVCAASAERTEIRDRGVVSNRVRVTARARAVGPPHRLPPGQMDAGDDRGSLQNEEKDGAE